jgi:hypothetical protein
LPACELFGLGMAWLLFPTNRLLLIDPSAPGTTPGA